MSRVLGASLTLLVGLACASNPAGQDEGMVLDYNGLLEGLRRAGAQVTAGGTVSQPFFAVPGRVILVGGEDVQVFEYRDAASAQAEARRVSPDGSTIGTSIVTWVAAPHFYQRGRVLVLYVGTSASVTGALAGVLGPQFAGR